MNLIDPKDEEPFDDPTDDGDLPYDEVGFDPYAGGQDSEDRWGEGVEVL